jgi:hypothetical protein
MVVEKHPRKCDDGTKSYSTTGFLKMFPTVAGIMVGLSA